MTLGASSTCRPRLSPAKAPALFCGPVRFVRPALAACVLSDARGSLLPGQMMLVQLPPFGVGRSTPVVDPGGHHVWAAAQRRRIGFSVTDPRNAGAGTLGLCLHRRGRKPT